MVAGSPVLEPVGAVDLVLVEQVSQALCQLVAFAQVAVVGEKAPQWLEVGAFDQLREQTHEAPSQGRLVQQRDLGDFIAAQHLSVQLPHEATRQLHIDGRGDTASPKVIFLWVFGQGQLEPLGNAVALYQRNLVFQWSQRVTAHPVHNQAAQVVQAVAVDNHEARME